MKINCCPATILGLKRDDVTPDVSVLFQAMPARFSCLFAIRLRGQRPGPQLGKAHVLVSVVRACSQREKHAFPLPHASHPHILPGSQIMGWIVCIRESASTALLFTRPAGMLRKYCPTLRKYCPTGPQFTRPAGTLQAFGHPIYLGTIYLFSQMIIYSNNSLHA